MNQTKHKELSAQVAALRLRIPHEQKRLNHYLDQTAIHFHSTVHLGWLCLLWGIWLIKSQAKIVLLYTRMMLASSRLKGCDASLDDIIPANVPDEVSLLASGTQACSAGDVPEVPKGQGLAPSACSAFSFTETDSEAAYSSEGSGRQSKPPHSDPCQLAVGQPERGYESPQVGLPHSDVHETEDERKNRLSAPRIADAKSRLYPDK